MGKKIHSGTIGGENLEKLWKTFLGSIFVTITFPILFVVFTVFYGIGESVKKYYSTKRGPSVAKVRGMDGAFGHEVAESRPFICSYFTAEGTPDLQKIKTKFEENILESRNSEGEYQYRKLKQSIGRRYAYFLWRDTDDFSIDDHIRLVDLDSVKLDEQPTKDSKDNIVSERLKDCDEKELSERKYRELICRYLTTYASKPLSRNKPQWELIVLTRKDGRYTCMLRIHHSIGDGVSLIRMFVEKLVEPAINPPAVGPKTPNIIFIVLWHIWALSLFPFGIWYLLFHQDNNALHGPKLSGKKIYRISNGISLADVKSITRKFKATVNDVMMACLSAALTNHYKRKNTPSEWTTILIPVSLHNLQQENVLVNKFAWAICLLPTEYQGSALTRLKAIKATLDAMKRDPLITTFYYVVRIINGIFPAKIAEKLFYAHGITLTCSNVPGPQQEVRVFGDKVVETTFMLPDRAPTGCGVAILSYNGVIRPTIMVDRGLVEHEYEADQIMADFEKEIQDLQNELKGM